MKKSEMRKIIKEVIESHKSCCNDWNLAEFVLQKLENFKMLPPISFHKMKHLGENEWEPENDGN